MKGIMSIGFYFPELRIGEKINRRLKGSERAVANYDEDTITMGVEAVFSTPDYNKFNLKNLFFCTTTPVYIEKSNSSLIATVTSLERSVTAVDITGSLRAGSLGILQALKSDGNSLIVVSDKRRYELDSSDALSSGDGAVSVVIAEGDDLIAEFISSASITAETMDEWRMEGDVLHSSERKFILENEAIPLIRECVLKILNDTGLKAGEISKVVFPFFEHRSNLSIAKIIGIPEERVYIPHFFESIGYTGSSFPLISSSEAILNGKQDEFVLLISYSSGADAMLFKISGAGSKNAAKSIEGLKKALNRKRIIEDKLLLQKIRGDVDAERISAFTMLPLYIRDIKQCLQLKGLRCKICGAIQYPWRYICFNCNNEKQFDEVQLARSGRVYTYTRDFLVPSPVTPVGMVVLDLDGGGRFYCQVADSPFCAPEIGKEAELTFRRIHEGGGFVNYFWKARLVEEKQ